MPSLQQIIPNRKELLVEDLLFNSNPDQLLFFDKRTISFLHQLSRAILKSKKLNAVPAFVALAFWLRKTSVNQLAEQYSNLHDRQRSDNEIPAVFHVCPSNVDTIFLYSLALSLLCGNKNYLRISSRTESVLLDELFDLMNIEISKEPLFGSYIKLLSYGHEDEISSSLSEASKFRMIWGGDETVKHFKELKVNKDSIDFYFPNRISIALIEATAYFELNEEQKDEVARKFVVDGYQFDQKACSSPQQLFVISDADQYQRFQREFYERCLPHASNLYEQDWFSTASMKLNRMAGDAAEETTAANQFSDLRVVLSEQNDLELLESCGTGLFYSNRLDNLESLQSIFSDKLQTIAQFGLQEDQIAAFKKLLPKQARLVEMGGALDFHHIWDGYDLLAELSA